MNKAGKSLVKEIINVSVVALGMSPLKCMCVLVPSAVVCVVVM
jgi:hypothetical protein